MKHSLVSYKVLVRPAAEGYKESTRPQRPSLLVDSVDVVSRPSPILVLSSNDSHEALGGLA